MIDLLPCPFCKREARSWKPGIIQKRLCACSNRECGAYFIKFTPDKWNTRHIPENAKALDWFKSHIRIESLQEHEEYKTIVRALGGAE